MAHEVIKRVGKRAYRYRVETYRDEKTRKVRSRWTYLGTAGAPEPGRLGPAVARRAPAKTREKLVDALERLLSTRPLAEITAGLVAAEAGLAHGTFYRYFADKRAVFMALLDRIREQVERERPTFDPPFGGPAQERLRVRAWLEASLGKPAEHPAAVRAYFELLENDEMLQAARKTRSVERIEALTDYLERLARAGTIALDDAGVVSAALVALSDAVFREAALARNPIDDRMMKGVASVFDRAIFGADREQRPAL
jgi:AcrR family transcriptional regulator